MHPEPLADLAALIPADRLSTTQAQRDLHARDQSSHPACPPDVVIWPVSTEEVSAVLAIAHAHGVAVTPWGAGTSLEGNTIPLSGGIVLNFQRMDRIVAVHEQDFQVTVQPGIFYKDMNKILARSGLFFAPDPGANASIGGMLANNAAGSRTVKYGATRDNVLALEVVLADGTVIRTGNRSVKQSAGYDLTHLFVGSEGTLGVITEATLKLAPLPEHFSAATAAFPDVQAAAQAVFDIIGSGLGPAALELMDVEAMRILNTEEAFDFPVFPHLFMEFIGPGETALAEILALAEEICQERGATTFNAGMGHAARNQLWEGRHRLFEIQQRNYPGQTWLITDVSVPISRYPDLVAVGADLMQELAVHGSLFGHAGDGNLHSVLFFPPEDAHYQRAKQFNDRLVAAAQSMEGTCTGEHGVGMGKQRYLAAELTPATLATMRVIKQTLDPKNILNPGKIIT